MDNLNQNFSTQDKEVADQVADEILTVEESDQDRLFFILLLIFLLSLLFLVCCSFFGGYNNYLVREIGQEKFSVKIDVDESLIDDQNTTPSGGDKDKTTPTDSQDQRKDQNEDENKEKDDDKKHQEEEEKPKPIDPGMILFSYDSGSNYISMHNVYPTPDAVGMNYTGNKQYFDFTVSITYVNKKEGDTTYEITAVPTLNNTLPQKDVRVYLTEDDHAVSINENAISNFSALPKSKFQTNGRVLYKKTVSGNHSANYVFRMWLSSDANLTEVSRKFGCKIVINGYYE